MQDVEVERPVKRYGSSQSSSDDSSPEKPQFPTSCSSLPLSSDDEKATIQHQFNDKTYTISTGELKAGECAATSLVVSQRDSQLVYSSSNFKSNISDKNINSVESEVVPSPAASSATNEVSEVSDFDVVGEMDRVGGYVTLSPSKDYGNVFSPLETRKISEENVMLINKGEKTPHTLKKRPSNTICYK